LADAFQRMDPVVGHPELEPACAAFVTGSATLTPAEQVDIYRRQFWLRHRDALVEDYPGLRHILGDDAFDDFVRGYLAAYPPRTPSLRDLGADTARFAETYPFPAHRELALDMIRYELAWVDVFDGADPPPLDPAVIARVPAEAWAVARVRLSPCVARLSLRHPVHRLRYAVLAGEDPALPAEVEGGVRLALYRKKNVLHYEELSRDAFALLELLAAGVPLVGACERLHEGKTEDEARELDRAVGSWFASWATWGFVAAIDLD
jgi:hypothetical protein